MYLKAAKIVNTTRLSVRIVSSKDHRNAYLENGMKRTDEQEREYNRLLQRVTIYNAQVRAFEFMSGMAKDLDGPIALLNKCKLPYKCSDTNTIMCVYTKVELQCLQTYYYIVANEIGRCWLEED